ncbi:MAG: pyridoxal phosphate-dependent aminotransferase [Blastocatellia bacterium]|nr:pyridoxal phosphate-dependent aminotransferase [Blastocatellia bacterium]
MIPNFANRMEQVQTPVIPVVGELIRNNPGTISLGQGIVHYSPPPQAFERIPALLRDPELHKYQAVHGIPELLAEIEKKLAQDNNLTIDGSNCIVVTSGGNMAFMNAVLAITHPGDEIILNVPYYFNHEMAIMMASCKAVLVATDENYQLRPEALEAAITDKTRAIVTVSPNNPTGAVYSESSLRAVNDICRKHGIYHINDEAYDYFVYDDAQHFSPASIADSGEHTISLFSLSKAYGFAGWRIGFMVIPQHLFTAVRKIQDTILICPTVISQHVAAGAMQVGADYCRGYLSELAEVRQLVMHELQQINSFCVAPPADGAFYFLLRLDTKLKPLPLVERLVREHRVAAIPGDAFGMHDGCYLRVAYGALQKETVAEGIGRLVSGLKSIIGA